MTETHARMAALLFARYRDVTRKIEKHSLFWSARNDNDRALESTARRNYLQFIRRTGMTKWREYV